MYRQIKPWRREKLFWRLRARTIGNKWKETSKKKKEKEVQLKNKLKQATKVYQAAAATTTTPSVTSPLVGVLVPTTTPTNHQVGHTLEELGSICSTTSFINFLCVASLLLILLFFFHLNCFLGPVATSSHYHWVKRSRSNLFFFISFVHWKVVSFLFTFDIAAWNRQA